jgi:hypothetical protein
MTRLLVLALVLVGCQRETASYNVDVPPPTGSAPMVLPMASASPRQTSSAVPLPSGFRAGDSVEVEWHGDWYPARVLAVTTPFPPTYHIRYDGYGEEWDEDVGLDRIRPRAE